MAGDQAPTWKGLKIVHSDVRAEGSGGSGVPQQPGSSRAAAGRQVLPSKSRKGFWSKWNNAALLEHSSTQSFPTWSNRRHAAVACGPLAMLLAAQVEIIVHNAELRHLMRTRLSQLAESEVWVLDGSWELAGELTADMEQPPCEVAEWDRLFIVVNNNDQAWRHVQEGVLRLLSASSTLQLPQGSLIQFCKNTHKVQLSPPTCSLESWLEEGFRSEKLFTEELKRLQAHAALAAEDPELQRTLQEACPEFAAAAFIYTVRHSLCMRCTPDSRWQWPRYCEDLGTLAEAQEASPLGQLIHNDHAVPGFTFGCQDLDAKLVHHVHYDDEQGSHFYTVSPELGEGIAPKLPATSILGLVLGDEVHRSMKEEVNVMRGFNEPVLILSEAMTSTATHKEDNIASSLNLMHAGAPKEWSWVPWCSHTSFEDWLTKHHKLDASLAKKSYEGFNQWAAETGGEERVLLQGPRQMVVTMVGSLWHQTCSSGASMCESCNNFTGASSPGIKGEAKQQLQCKSTKKNAKLIAESYPCMQP